MIANVRLSAHFSYSLIIRLVAKNIRDNEHRRWIQDNFLRWHDVTLANGIRVRQSRAYCLEMRCKFLLYSAVDMHNPGKEYSRAQYRRVFVIYSPPLQLS